MILELTINTPTITPCTENYHAMHPETGGAFCDHCQKKVHDVSHMRAEELHAFKKQFPEACVRMSAKALKPVISYSTMHMSKQSPLHRFAFALFMIFGTFLFSCSEEEYTDTLQQIETLALRMQNTEQHPVETNNPVAEQPVEHPALIKHNCRCEELEVKQEEIVETQVISTDTPEVQLDVITIVGHRDRRHDQSETVIHYMGLLAYHPVKHVVHLDSIVDHPKIIPTSTQLSLGAFPNPAMTSTVISYTLEEDAPINLLIYNLQGQLISEIENNALQPAGTYTTQLSVDEWDAGLYPIILISGETRKTFMLSVKH